MKQRQIIDECKIESHLLTNDFQGKLGKIVELFEVNSHHYNHNCEIAYYEKNSAEFGLNNWMPIIYFPKIGNDNPLGFIWAILHEFGHYLSPPAFKANVDWEIVNGTKVRKDKRFIMIREILAWKYAYKLAKDKDFFTNDKDEESFKECQDKRLGEYCEHCEISNDEFLELKGMSLEDLEKLLLKDYY
ncbi:MAG: hypothetical protein U0Y10_21760 [Spirosomataceae bacterium]